MSTRAEFLMNQIQVVETSWTKVKQEVIEEMRQLKQAKNAQAQQFREEGERHFLERVRKMSFQQRVAFLFSPQALEP